MGAYPANGNPMLSEGLTGRSTELKCSLTRLKSKPRPNLKDNAETRPCGTRHHYYPYDCEWST